MPDTVWDVAKHLTNVALEQAYGATGDPRFDATTNASHAIAVTSVYNQLSMLREAGYPGTQDIPPDLIDRQTGQMLPGREVLKNRHLLGSLYDYLGGRAQQHGAFPNVTTVYDKVNNTADAYSGGIDFANEPNA